MTTQHSLQLPGGGTIAVTLFEPAAPARACVIVPCAMGVEQWFYARFAAWLAQQGYLAVTFDYRGIGASAPPSLRGFQVDIVGWAREDCAAVIEFAKARAAEVPLCWIGHSLGGQLIGLIPNRDKIDRIMTVATGSGYWLENSWPTRRMVWWLWFVVVPLVLPLVGYFPGKHLRKVGNLPEGVMRQWRRWCLSREYVVGAEGEQVREAYASVRTPIVSLSFTDDEMMSAASVRSLHALYRSAPIDCRRIAPAQVGARRIGHFGFFRSQFAATLWPLAREWIEASLPKGELQAARG